MSVDIIDALARQTAMVTRRTALAAVFSAGLSARVFSETEARNRKQHGKRRRRRNKVIANAFGCLNVGDRCDGTDLACCSGVCQQERGNGTRKRRKSFCVAHDEGGCRPEQDFCIDGDVGTTCGVGGVCLRTTGQAGFCGLLVGSDCFSCSTDSECAASFGAGAACVVCAACGESSGGTGCLPPATGQQPSAS